MTTVDYWIKHLMLTPHPEGGFYRETYRSTIEISRQMLPKGYSGKRNLVTSIYFLLRSDEISRFHRLKSDEIWYYHYGSPLQIISIDKQGAKHKVKLGPNANKDEHFSTLISSGHIFAAEVQKKNSFTVMSCIVSPGFDFSDFELFNKEDLLQAYPTHKDLIEKYG